MSETPNLNRVDVVTLAKLSHTMKRDGVSGTALHPSAVVSIADIIDRAIGMPLMVPTRYEGAAEADRLFPGSPPSRHGFNAGVAWIINKLGEEHASAFAMENEVQEPKLPPTDVPTSIFLKCGHIIVIDGTTVSLDATKAPLHECCVKAIAGEPS